MQTSRVDDPVSGLSDYDPEATIPSLFDDVAARSADRIALVCGPRSLTYSELQARSNQLAHRLIETGVKPGDRVAICADRSPELIVSILGILKAGGVYVPIDPDYPESRIQLMTSEGRLASALVQRESAEKFSSGLIPVLAIDPEFAVIAPFPTTSPGVPVSSTDAAYVMFTSGSTGRPKGVVITHRGVCQLVRGQSYLPFGPELRLLVSSSPSFDAMTIEVWGALLNGGRCVVFAPATIDIDEFEATVRREGVNACFLTTRLFNRIVDLRPAVLSPLLHVITGGEAMSVEHARRAIAALPGTVILNGYGPTECTTFSTIHRLPSRPEEIGRVIPIGRALAHTRCLIVDDDLRPVPEGETGELLISGDGVSPGYFNQPQLTNERFVRLQGASGDARYYRSGDRCRLLPSGAFGYEGRRDGQVKLRGFRIELSEIEEALRQHADVRDAAVALLPAPSGSPQLVAFVMTTATTITADDRAWRAHVAGILPVFMCPAQYRLVSALPLTRNGKLDRAALATLPAEILAANPPHRAPHSELEKVLAAIWGEALGVKNLSSDDDFFVRGGDSLLAIQVVGDMERVLDRRVSISAIYDAPTVAIMAQWLGEQQFSFGAPALRGSGPGAPLFYIPGIFGYALLPQAIARRLEGICPYCDNLHFPGTLGSETPFETVEEIAAALVKQIRECSPEGPCNLAGYSFAGELAFEVARQLRREGREVPRVILLDSMTTDAERARGLFAGAIAAVRYLVSCDPDARRHLITTRWRQFRSFKWRRFRWRRGSENRLTSQEPGHRTYHPSLRARCAYRPAPADTRGIFIRSRIQPFSIFFEYSALAHGGWKDLFSRGLEIHELECNHHQLIVEPAISHVAEIVLRELQPDQP